MKITKEEILKIANMSNLDLHDDEIPSLIKEIDDVLTYAVRVKEVAADVEEPLTKNVNMFREDVVVKTNPELVLSRSPEREENFFVVPAVLEGNK